MAPALRAASCNCLILGTVAAQRGLWSHWGGTMSRIRNAVVAPSSLTDFNSGGGGGCTFAQSSKISAEANAAKVSIRVMAAIAAPRKRVRVFDMVSSSDLNYFEICRSITLPFEVTCGEYAGIIWMPSSFIARPLEGARSIRPAYV